MCGRTACTLGPERFRLACSYKPGKAGGKDKYQKARWVDQQGCKQYQPSCNIAPTDTLPVLVRGELGSCPDEERVIMPMRWGLVPFFHKGEVTDMKLTTFNARSEEFLNKATFSTPFKRNQRCVVVCDGYYEWKKSDAARQPYFFYTEGDSKWDGSCDVNSLSEEKVWNEDDGWTGPRLTMMAGIFDTWKSDEKETLYSCTILTQASNDHLKWIHHRMPVFLSSPAEVQGWLAVGEEQSPGPLDLITPADSLVWHQVSPDLNSARNKAVTYAPLRSTKQAGFMSAWLQKGQKRPAEEEETPAKREMK